MGGILVYIEFGGLTVPRSNMHIIYRHSIVCCSKYFSVCDVPNGLHYVKWVAIFTLCKISSINGCFNNVENSVHISTTLTVAIFKACH